MAVEIRKAVFADARELADLLVDIGLFEAVNNQPPEAVTRQVESRITQCLADDSHSIYVAQSREVKIVGYSSVHWLPYLFMNGPEGYVSELFVRTSARGQGIGKQLLQAVEAAAQDRGCARLSLINLRNRESYLRKFYVKAGWEERSDAANFVYRISHNESFLLKFLASS